MCGFRPSMADSIPLFAPNYRLTFKDHTPHAIRNLIRHADNHFWLISRRKVITEKIASFLNDGESFLEVGSGAADIPRELQNRGIKVTVSDIQTNGLTYAVNQKIGSVVQFDLYHPIYRDHFDAVGAFDVIEHLEDDLTAAKHLLDIVKPGGFVFVTVPAHKWLKDSDVLFAIGSSLTRTSYGQSFPENKVLIHNSENIDDINKDYSIDVGLNGDAKLTLQSLIEAVKEEIGASGREDTNGVVNEISSLKSQWLAEWAPLLNSDEKPINTYRVIGDLQKTLDKDNSIVTHDAGAPRDTIMPFYTASLPHTYIGWGKTTHLGYGIPLMIGAKKAKPERFCLNFMGDGAFGMSGLDLETSVRAGLPITTVLLNNGGMATYPGGYPASKELSGVTYMSGDYATIAEGLGAVGIRVTEPSGVIPAIEEAKRLNADGKTCLLDIKTNLEGKRSNFM